MRGKALQKKAPQVKAAIQKILDTNDIYCLNTNTILQGLPANLKISRRTIERYLDEMDFDLEARRRAARDKELQAAFDFLGTMNLSPQAISKRLPFQVAENTLKDELRTLGLYPFPDKRAFVREQIARIKKAHPGIYNTEIRIALGNLKDPIKISLPTLAERLKEMDAGDGAD